MSELEVMDLNSGVDITVSVDGARVLGHASDISQINGLMSDFFNSEIIDEDGDESLKAKMKCGNVEAEAREGDSMGENQGTERGLENFDKVVGHGTADSYGDLHMEMETFDDKEVGVEIEVNSDNFETANLFVQHPNDGEVSLVVDLNECDSSEEKFMPDNTINNEGIDFKEGFSELRDQLYVENATDCNKEDVKNRNTRVASNDADTKPREDMDENGFKSGTFIPQKRGRDNHSEKEGELFVSDLVWGKVRSHPWWPGQIFEPSSASDKAMKYFKKDSYLIAYFGDQTFAWNEVSNIRPFRLYFSEMEKQSKAEAFRHAVDGALDEVSRRVKCGLACRCLPEAVTDRVNSQVVINAGIEEQSSRIFGGDSLSAAPLFVPAELIDCLKSLAEAPNAGVDRLQFATARAQLLAFSRWKGYYQLPEFEGLAEISENDADLMILNGEKIFEEVLEVLPGHKKDDALAGKGKFSTEESPHKRQDQATKGQRNKRQWVMELMPTISSSFSNSESTYQQEVNGKMASLSSKKKCKATGAISLDKVRNGLPLPMMNDHAAYQPKKRIKVEEQGRVVRKLDTRSSCKPSDRSSRKAIPNNIRMPVMVPGSGLSTSSIGKPSRRRITLQECPLRDEMLSKLVIAAKNPMDTCTLLTSIAGFFFDFRNSICLENNIMLRNEELSGKLKSEDASELVTAETFEFKGMEDSYWTDRIIQSNLEEQVLIEPKAQTEKDTLVAEPDGLDLLNLDKDITTQNNLEKREAFESGSQKSLLDAELPSLYPLNSDKDHDCGNNATVADMDSHNSPHIDENSDECSPTILILNFNNLESIPSTANLNKIFNHYGPLNELETEILCKSKRAKVVFKRRSDAETAFSSTGKFSTFGPSLVSYRLKYLPKTYKASRTLKAKRRRKNATSALQGRM